jgi:hypothetical protein
MQQRIRDLSRRELLKLFGITVGASMAGAAMPAKIQAQSTKVTPRKNCRNVLVIQNGGAMSPWETLDFKDTKWTAKDLEVQKIRDEFYLPKTLFPRGVDVWAPHASIVRSTRSVALVHFPAQYHTQAGRPLNTAIVREIPALGAIVAKELDSERRESDTFPTYMSFDMWNIRCPPIGSGMLPSKFAGMDVNSNSVFNSFGGGEENSKNNAALEERWDVLGRWAEVSGVNDGLGPKAEEYQSSYDYAIRVLTDKRFQKVLKISDEDKKRYGVDQDTGVAKVGLGMLLARNVLAADAGARMLWVANGFSGGNGGFDNHSNLYSHKNVPSAGAIPIYMSCPRLDRGLSSLVEDLIKMPGHEPGKTMFDETMIVLAHEFGRTPDMNTAAGRDHFGDHYSNLFMGGGVKPGRFIGKTDETGAKLLDLGWKYKEQPMMDHITSTIYSALGIDYSKKIVNTPSGRAYEYQQTAPLGGPKFIPLTEINELFI